MKILFVGYRDKRHSKFGGYDYISLFPNADYYNAENFPFGSIPVGVRGKKLNLLCLDLISRLQADKYDVIHYFYSDFMLFKKIPKRRNCKFIATIHMRSESFSRKQINVLKSFDKVICLSSSEEIRLRKMGINAFFVPHGFNRPIFIFKPLEKLNNSKINIFYSGMNYRDFDTFVKIVDFSKQEGLNICFYVVGQSKENKERLFNKENVVICPRLSDDEYYSLLSLCDYNFLPLTFSTANNALMEAQALGISSVLPKIDGVLDYADEKGNLFYNNLSELKKMFIKLPKESSKKDLVNFSEKFNWKRVYEKLEGLYDER